VNKKRVQWLMRLAVAPLPPRRASWCGADDEPTTGAWYPNRRADVTPTRPDQLWVTDLTYLTVGRESAFLAVLLDAWSPRVIGLRISVDVDHSFRPMSIAGFCSGRSNKTRAQRATDLPDCSKQRWGKSDQVS
jgi:transposase InsO family protein